MRKERISILVVDNSPQDIGIIKTVLNKSDDIDYYIDTASSCTDAIKKAAEGKFHLALVDYGLEGMNGLEVLDEINRSRLSLPVVMIITRGDEKLAVEVIKKGAYDYLNREEIKSVVLTRTIQGVLKIKRLEDKLRESHEKLEKTAIRDGLTRLYNHRYLQETLKNEYKKVKRHMQPFSCIMLDLDHFKSVNDSYGHQFGDFVLVQSAEILKKLVRDTDFVARYGGEEFFIILPNTDLKGALILGERIRNSFAQHTFKKGEISEVVTISLGISSTLDSNVIKKEDLIANADSALYHAKWRGRNNVCAWEEIESEDKVKVKEDVKMINDFCERLRSLNENIKEACIGSSQSIFRELKHGWDYINEHSNRVGLYVERLTRELLMSDDEINVIKRAALLHDIGMVGISLKILKKKNKLTREEYELIKRHSSIGVKIMEQTKLFERELPMILYHHERFDGNGYPHKLRGNIIPYGARILAITEAYDAMISGTAYCKASSSSDTIAELKRCAGFQFEPKLVNVFISTIARATPPLPSPLEGEG